MRKTPVLLAAIPALILTVAFGIGCQPSVGESSAGETPVVREPATETDAEAATAPDEDGASAGNGASAGAGTAAAGAGDGGAVARSGDAVARAGDASDGAVAGDAVAGDGQARAGEAEADGGEARSRGNASRSSEVTMRIGGLGTEFSGSCAVDGEERDISGRAPERFVFELDGRKLECNLRNRGGGTLKVDLSGEDHRAALTTAGGGDLRFTISESGFSSSTSS